MKLLFIHGSGGCKESWQYQTKHFKGSEAIDLPGHPVGEPCTTIDDYVEWLHGYINEKGYADLVIAGHSLGGGIALLYGLKYPESLKGLITVGSGARLRVHPMFLDGLQYLPFAVTHDPFASSSGSLRERDTREASGAVQGSAHGLASWSRPRR